VNIRIDISLPADIDQRAFVDETPGTPVPRRGVEDFHTAAQPMAKGRTRGPIVPAEAGQLPSIGTFGGRGAREWDRFCGIFPASLKIGITCVNRNAFSLVALQPGAGRRVAPAYDQTDS
jgi:hypothetical protein